MCRSSSKIFSCKQSEVESQSDGQDCESVGETYQIKLFIRLPDNLGLELLHVKVRSHI